MSDAIICRQCGVGDGELVACDSCEKMVLHEELCHHDYEGVFCDECDEFIDEEAEAWLKELEEANNHPHRRPATAPTFDEDWEPGE